MSDVEYMLMRDGKEKKSAGRGAAHRKRGSKSKSCTLPFEYGSKKNRNGEVRVTNLHRPMKWAEFKALSEDLRKIYLEYILETYAPSQRMLANMFGISRSSVQFAINDLGVKWPSRNLGEMHTPEQKIKTEMFKAFCNGVVGGGQKPQAPAAMTENIPEDTTESEALPAEVTCVPEDEAENVPEVNVEQPEPLTTKVVGTGCRMESMQLSFSNVSSWDELFERLRGIPLDGPTAIKIDCQPQPQ